MLINIGNIFLTSENNLKNLKQLSLSQARKVKSKSTINDVQLAIKQSNAVSQTITDDDFDYKKNGTQITSTHRQPASKTGWMETLLYC